MSQHVITDLRRELEKTRLALVATQTHLAAHAEANAALYFTCQNRHPLAVRTTTITENGVRRAVRHEIVCPACEADGITEVRLPDLDESDDDD